MPKFDCSGLFPYQDGASAEVESNKTDVTIHLFSSDGEVKEVKMDIDNIFVFLDNIRRIQTGESDA